MGEGQSMRQYTNRLGASTLHSEECGFKSRLPPKQHRREPRRRVVKFLRKWLIDKFPNRFWIFIGFGWVVWMVVRIVFGYANSPDYFIAVLAIVLCVFNDKMSEVDRNSEREL